MLSIAARLSRAANFGQKETWQEIRKHCDIQKCNKVGLYTIAVVKKRMRQLVKLAER